VSGGILPVTGVNLEGLLTVAAAFLAAGMLVLLAAGKGGRRLRARRTAR
jgi:hypothetical protein